MWEKVFRRRDPRPDARDGTANAEAVELEARVVAFGESLRTHSFTPDGTDADVLPRRDLGKALDAYDAAARALTAGADGGPDAEGVLRALHAGRHALDRLDARLAGRPRPRHTPLCFFDARHGPATTHVRWTPSDGEPSMVAVCAADGVQVREGREPLMSRSTRAALASRKVTGRGTTSHRVELPRERPVVLVVRTERAARVEVRVEDKAGRSSRFYPLGGGVDPVVARVAVPGEHRALGFTVTFPDGEEVGWTADAASLRAVPEVGDGMRGDGCDVVRFEGAAEGWVLRHRGRGPVAIEALDDDLAFWASVASGSGDVDLEFRWPGPGHYQVRAGGTWLLEAADASDAS